MTMYIRFGDLPEGGKSYNNETGTYEAGVSCYRAEWQSSDRDVICVSVPSDICIGTINQIADRPVYIVTGDLLDERGGDGEPLLINVTAEYVGPVEIVNYCVDED
ncbi:MAG: hypothetical protein IRY85_14930 [Micromonosporaceae bacterium]|nr:hypothetical protein [Micromonosporaceae bacterium]